MIASLPWAPQCLDAAHGWIGVGGPDNGLCAFLYIGQRRTSEDIGGTDSRSHAEVDALLPLDLDSGSGLRLLDRNSSSENQRSTRSLSQRKLDIQFHELGTSIVNSVSIYRLRSEQRGTFDQTVAVLT